MGNACGCAAEPIGGGGGHGGGGGSDHVAHHDLNWFIHEDVKATFDFIKPLGQGAYGEVSLVRRKVDGKKLPYQTVEGQEFAIKEIKVSSLEDEADLIGFKQECDLQRRLLHPNICRLFAVYSTPRLVHMVVELVDGGDLMEEIDRTGTVLSEAFAAKVIRRSCEALEFMHEQGVAHRDIKPENIMLLRDHAKKGSAVVKLGDFGFAIEGHDHMLMTTCGSPMYIAPEIIARQGYSTTCDLWSLGVVCFQMLFGSNPFDMDGRTPNIARLFQDIQHKPVQFPAGGNVSAEARDLIGHMLAKDPQKRYAASNVLRHEWVIQATTPGRKFASYREPLMDSVREGLLQIHSARNGWRKAQAKTRTLNLVNSLKAGAAAAGRAAPAAGH
eukprot:COSAG01_NODE_144_length_24108_cov_11.490441_30_plen_385_part_00